MEQLWSPWRSQFIAAQTEQKETSPSSPFTDAWNHPERDAAHHMIHRGERTFIIMNKYPYNAGHLLVIPVRETADFLEVTVEERRELMEMIRFGTAILKEALSPHGFNIGMNLGRTAGAAIDTHIHAHIVPRWNGDTNFMPVLDEVRVISEEMEAVYHKLREAREVLLSKNHESFMGNDGDEE